MTDLIKRLREWQYKFYLDGDVDMEGLLGNAATALEDQLQWIPVTERLPEDSPENQGKKVIGCIVAHDPYGNGKLKVQFRQRQFDKYSNKWYWAKIGGCTVTHWMPLPEAPKGE